MNLHRPLDIRIDRLALRAMPPGGEQRLKAAVEVELNRLIANDRAGLGHAPHDAQTQDRHRVPGPQQTLQSCAKQIAATIHRAIRTS